MNIWILMTLFFKNVDNYYRYLNITYILSFKGLDQEGILTGATVALDPILTEGDHEAGPIAQSIVVEGAAVIHQCLTGEGTLVAEYVVNVTKVL